MVGTQAVPASAAPAAPDARITRGLGLYLNLTGAEAKMLARLWVVGGGAGSTAACQILALRAKGPAANVAKLACQVGGALGTYALLQSVTALSDRKVSDGSCWQFHVLGPSVMPMTPVPVAPAGNCK